MLLGTAAYLAPEMIENNQATAQGDLYSVGIMAWEMLTGKVPFDSDNPVTLVSSMFMGTCRPWPRSVRALIRPWRRSSPI